MVDRIALVDDDQNILTSVSLTLESEGFEVDCYHDGEAALVGLARRPANLGVFDIKMPRMDGMDLLQRLRQKSAMRVIFLTLNVWHTLTANHTPPATVIIRKFCSSIIFSL